MSIFLTAAERAFIKSQYTNGVTARLYWNTLNRVNRRAESPGLLTHTDTVEWWHVVDEAVCDTAMMYALQPSTMLATWLRNTTLSIVRRSEDEWVGPWFRNHSIKPAMAELETAHVTRAVAVTLDLAPDVFTPDEQAEVLACLNDRAIPMATRHLDHDNGFHNHRCIIYCGLAVAAAVANHREGMDRAAKEFLYYAQAYQPDGTYAETLQYGNYATLNMVLAYEALTRRDPAYAKTLKPQTYAGSATLAAYSHLYTKALSGWGQEPIPRAINFGDSAAIFTPSAEILLHIATHCRESHPTDAALARWLFDTVIDIYPQPVPNDRASFGFVNRPGFLTMPLMARAAAAKSPTELKLPLLHSFSNGDTIARDAWDGRTVFAVRAGGDPMAVASHLHGDLNSIFLVHNRERLLVDAGHSCYRSLVHELELSSITHNTCTFNIPGEPRPLQQKRLTNRLVKDGQLEPPIERGVKRLLVAQLDEIQVTVSDAAPAYGAPISQFVRICILCGPHALFVIDHINSDVPVTTRWNWLLNNRDRRAEFKPVLPDRVIFRRGDAGMKLFNFSNGAFGGPEYAFVHDAYHPLPNQFGEGSTGSGVLIHWRERAPATTRSAIHAAALDDTGRIASWHHKVAGNTVTLAGNDGQTEWSLDSAPLPDHTYTHKISSKVLNKSWLLSLRPGQPWQLAHA